MEPIVRCHIDNKDEQELLDKLKKQRKHMKQRGKEYKEQLEEMNKRVYAKPLLMQEYNKKNARLKHLILIRDTAIQSGVKDINTIFNTEERDLLQEVDLTKC
jgi:hypothetical protein